MSTHYQLAAAGREDRRAATPRRARAASSAPAATRWCTARATASGSSSHRRCPTRRTRCSARWNSSTPSRMPASRTRPSSAPPTTPRRGRTCCGRRSGPAAGLTCSPRSSPRNDVPFELAAASQDALDHPQMVHNGHVIEVDDPVVGQRRARSDRWRACRATPSVIRTSAPALGDHGPRFAAPTAPLDHRADGPMPDHPLSGITIVEFGFFYAMPFGVTLAASLGARVIKLEDRHGDPIRAAFGGDAGSAKVTEGKESLSVDLKSESGQAIVRQLLASADVFVRRVPSRRRRASRARLRVGGDAQPAAGLRALGRATAPTARTPPGRCTRSPPVACAGNFQRHARFWMDPELSRRLQRARAPGGRDATLARTGRRRLQRRARGVHVDPPRAHPPARAPARASSSAPP